MGAFSKSKFRLIPLDSLPEGIDLKTYQASDKHYAENFLHNSALQRHDELTHKVYVLISPQDKEVVAFFSLYVNNIEGKMRDEDTYFPFLDVGFLSISSRYEFIENCKYVFKLFLLKTAEIAMYISSKAGCCFIRANVPFQFKKRKPMEELMAQNPLTPWLPEALEENHFIDLHNAPDYFIDIKKLSVRRYKGVLLKYYIYNLKST